MRSLVLVLLPAACGDDSVQPPDGSMPDRPPIDAPIDAPTPIDGSNIDASPPPGMKVHPGAGLSLWAITSDDYVIYSDTSSVLWAQAATGGTPTQLTAIGSLAFVVPHGRVVFIWKDSTSTPPFRSALGVWSAAGGYHDATTSSLAFAAAASDDGAHIAFTANASTTSYDLIGANADLGQPAVLATSANATNCIPALRFLTATTAAVAYCANGQTTARLNTFAGATWTATTVLGNLSTPPWFSADTSGTLLFTSTSTGSGIVAQIGGGAVPIDTDVRDGFLTASGMNVIYRNGTALRRSSVSAPNPVTLDALGVVGFVAIAPDQTSLLFMSARSTSTGWNDLYMASTTTPGAPTTLRPSLDSQIFGDAFTADSSHALFFTNIVNNAGTLRTCTLGCVSPLAVASASYVAFALTGRNIVYNEGYDPATGQADIKKVDVVTMLPTPLVERADAGFFPTHAKDHIVFTWNAEAADAGLYLLPLP